MSTRRSADEGMLSALEGIPSFVPGRVLVTGSRNWDDRDTVARAMHAALVAMELRDSPNDVTLVHGAAKGLDSLAASVAERWGMRVESHPARWDLHGRAAGPIRNSEMVKLGANVCLAFPLGASPGTRNCMSAARRAGILTVDVPAILG